MKTFLNITLTILMITFSGAALAAGDAPKPPKLHWSFDGFHGTYDKAALQRGYKIYAQVIARFSSNIT